MPVAVARSVNALSKSTDFVSDVKSLIGNLDDIEVLFGWVLVATFIRPEKIGSIIRPDSNVTEDTYQGKVGLVLKLGHMAFQDDETISYGGFKANPDDWVVYRVGDGFDVTIRGVACRMLVDTSLKMRIKSPEIVF